MSTDSNTESGIAITCIWCPGPGLAARNKTSLLMEHGVTENHRTRMNRGEVAYSTHTAVYCPDCGGTLLRYIDSEVRREPVSSDEEARV